MPLEPFHFSTEDTDLLIDVQAIRAARPDPGADNPFDFEGYFEADYTATLPSGRSYEPTAEEDHAILDEIQRRLADQAAADAEDAALYKAECRADYDIPPR